ncbi:hypothetical protein VTK56DRAFT_8629 [Thermocarpiscus australiensis]
MKLGDQTGLSMLDKRPVISLEPLSGWASSCRPLAQLIRRVALHYTTSRRPLPHVKGWGRWAIVISLEAFSVVDAMIRPEIPEGSPAPQVTKGLGLLPYVHGTN